MTNNNVKMSIEEAVKRINERDEQRRIETNKLIDKFQIAYKLEDSDGNTFCFGGIESGFPWYRGRGGSKHIFNICGYTVIQKYDE